MKVVSRYNLLDEVGQGFMGVVYRAHDLLTNQIVALKQVRVTHSETDSISSQSDPRFRMSFAQEFRTLASLRHPHIISVLDYGFNENHNPFFTMDYIDTAQTFIVAAHGKPLTEQVNLTIQLLQALTYLHRRNILHRDVKPENVLVADDKVRVLDFGLSSKIGEKLGRSGTLAYMAPEVIQKRVPSVLSDLYAVGVMMCEMITGKLPYNPLEIWERFETPAGLAEIAGHPLEPIIETLLSPDPTQRFQSADALIKTLAQTTNIIIASETEAIRESYLQTAPFVGREKELNHLTSALDKATKCEGSVWFVGGESGVGKSRLLDELRIQALVDGFMVVRGQGVEGGGVPYKLWRDILPRLLLSVELTDEEANALRFILPNIEALIGREVPVLRASDSIDRQQQQLLDTIVHILRQQPTPLVIILEDLQWAIESLELFKQLAQVANNESWMLIGSYRFDESPEVPEGVDTAQVIYLKRLNDDKIAELSYAMLGETGKQEDIIALLQRETEGNAYFLVEIVRTLAEDAGQLSDIGRLTLPETIFSGGISKVTQRRLNRIAEWGKPLLKLAAVIGRELDLTLLDYLANDVSLEIWLTMCADAAVLEVDENQWRFSHDKIRESIVADLSTNEKPILHRQVATAIEIVYPDDSQQAIILANHWHNAGDANKEAFYCFQAAEHLRQLGLNQALSYALRAERLKPSDPHLRTKIGNLVAKNYFERGDYQTAKHHFDTALNLARKHNLTREELFALDGIGQIIYIAKDMEEALKHYEQAVAFAREKDDYFMLARLLKHQGFVLRFLGDHEGAYQVAVDSLDVIRKLDDPLELALILYSVSVIVRNRGEYQQGITYLEEGIAIFREFNAVSDLGHSLNNLGICHNLMGNLDEALKYLEEGMECRRQVEHFRGVHSSKSAIGDLYFKQKRYEEAEQMFQEALDFWGSIGDKWNTANSHADVGFPQLVRGNKDSAQQHWHSALEQSYAIKGMFVVLKAIIGFAWLAHSTGNTQYTIQLLSFARSHEASTVPLDELWIKPLIHKMNLLSLPPSNLDLDEIVADLLAD